MRAVAKKGGMKYHNKVESAAYYDIAIRAGVM